MTFPAGMGLVGQHDAASLARDVERSVAAGAAAVGGGPRVNGHLRSTFDPRAVIGASFAMRRITHLTGVRRTGERVDFGDCRLGRRCLTWEWWFPHIGVAWDVREPEGGDAEVEAKLAWAAERHILYFPPSTDLDAVREAVLVRRGDA